MTSTLSSQVWDWGTSLLPDVLAGLRAAGATGTLCVVSLTASRDLIFVDGELRAARSTAEHEKLGSWLVSKGLITEVLKQSTLLTQEGSDAPPLGHILVTRGVTAQEDLEETLESLALAILNRATTEERRSCRFKSGLEGGQLDTLPKIATPQLILLSARAVTDIQGMRAAIGNPDATIGLTSGVDVIVQSHDLVMPEIIILGKLHRERSLEQLETVSTLPEAEFVSATYALSSAGIIALRKTNETPAGEKPQTSKMPPPGKTDESVGHGGSAPSSGALADAEELRRLYGALAGVNHYEFLEVSTDATYEEIFNAWERFQRRFHPHRAVESGFEELTTVLKAVHQHGVEAFETLSSPTNRPRYDRMLRTTSARGNATLSSAATDFDSRRAREDLVQENLKMVDRLAKRKDIFSAIKLLEQTCDLDPQPSSLVKLANLMLVNPSWTNRALEKLKRAVEIDPSCVEGWLAVATVWRGQRSRERERKALEQALAADPTNTETVSRYRSLVGEEAMQLFLSRIPNS